MLTYMHHAYMRMHPAYKNHGYVHHGYMHDMKVEKEAVVTFAWVTRPKGPPTRSRGPEGPLTSSVLYNHIYDGCQLPHPHIVSK